MENNPKVTALTVAAILVVGVGGIYAINGSNNPFTEPQPLTQIPASPNIEKQFEDFLNSFLKSINDAMIAYREERRVLVEAVRPSNLIDPAYVEENYTMVQDLIPSLRARMDGVIKIFESSEKQVDQLLLNQPQPMRQAILEKWHKMKDGQSKTYIEFFSYEADLLTAYNDLISFYYNKRAVFSVDADNDITFQNPADTSEADRLQKVIDDLHAEQQTAMTRNQIQK